MKGHKISKLFFPLFALCVVFLTLGQFSAIIRVNQINLYLFDIAVPIFDVLVLSYLVVNKRRILLTAPFLFLLGFVSIGILSLLLTPLSLDYAETAISLSYSLRLVSYVLGAVSIYNLIVYKVFKVEKIDMLFIASGLFLFIAGLLQLLLFPDLGKLDVSLGWDPHKNRMVSTFFDPNFLGIYFFSCLAILLRKGARPGKTIWMRYSLITVFLFGILLTFSRSSWFAVAILIFFLGFKKRAVLLISLWVVIMAFLAVPRIQTRISGITDPQDSASYRLISWRNTWEIVKENWIFGIGYNSFRYAQRNYGFLDDTAFESHSSAGSDSSLLLALATNGILGFAFLTAFYVSALIDSMRRKNLTEVGYIVGLLGSSMFVNSLFYPQMFMIVLIILVAAKGVEPLTSAM